MISDKWDKKTYSGSAKSYYRNSFNHHLSVILRLFSHCNIFLTYLFYTKKEAKRLCTKECK